MDPYERSKIADAIKIIKAKSGETIVKQGDSGDIFFMVESGKLVALKSENGGAEKEVANYTENDYFGELALVHDIPRQATIKCLVFVVWWDQLHAVHSGPVLVQATVGSDRRHSEEERGEVQENGLEMRNMNNYTTNYIPWFNLFK